VQFTDDPGLASAVRSAEEIPLDDVTLRVIRVIDLLRQKLAGSDPARRRSKRLSDLVDAQGLLETYPHLRVELTPVELMVLDQLPF
jgi:hypothetical protein